MASQDAATAVCFLHLSLLLGGLGALLRHLPRLAGGMDDAFRNDFLDRDSLARLNGYQPALSASWLFQRSMSVPPGARPPRDFINRLMATNFGIMVGRCRLTVSKPVLKRLWFQRLTL